MAAGWADQIAVGTVHELADVVEVVAATRPDVTVVALTPAMHLPPALPKQSVPTVGFDGPRRRASPSRVAGAGCGEAGIVDASPRCVARTRCRQVLAAVRDAGMEIHQFVLHLALWLGRLRAGTTRSIEVDQWLAHLDPIVHTVARAT